MTMVAAGSIVLCGATGTGATIVVDAAGGGDYTMIQDAVDASADGDIIVISPGTYVDDDGDGNIVDVSSQELTIMASASGVILDGGGTARGIYIQNGDMDVQGLDFVDCVTTASWGGGGIACRANGYEFLLSSCTFTNCGDASEFGTGGAVSIYSTMLASPITYTVSDCTFDGSQSTSYGGAMFLQDAHGTIVNCSFSGGSASNGGGIEFRRSVSVMDTCSFTGFVASNGGAIRIYNSDADVTATGCTFSGNSASWGSAIYVQWGLLDLVDCDVSDNTGLRSGALHLRSDTIASLTSCTISGNEATESGYAGVTGDEDAVLSLTSNTFCDHVAGGDVEIVYTDGGGNDIGNWCCPGDVDQSGGVDSDDIMSLIDAWAISDAADNRSDCDRDGDVGVVDLLGLLQQWGTCSS